MIFSSTVFLFIFLPVLLAIYFITPRPLKNAVLFLSSIFFYAWGEPRNVLVMLGSIVINYVLGLLVSKTKNPARKLLLILSVVINLGILFVFKYLNFTLDNINRIPGVVIEFTRIALPIGISFYTFQIMSYVIDVYRGEVKPQRNILNLGLYISLFPQLIAGPIVRYSDIESQIKNRTHSLAKVQEGVIRFAVGFSKKILLADQAAVVANLAFGGNYPSVWGNWVGIIAYTLQIYFDFSGYSDMAIGLGKIFGFEFVENFDYPYISRSIQEFWRRWHISLSSWFRDYVYIPLGGNRRGTVRTYINLIIVFLLTGFWHGASWNFIVWGLYYAFFLVIERLGFNKILKSLPKVISHLYALIVIIFGWIFFRAESLMDALLYIKGMFTTSGRDLINLLYIVNNKSIFFLVVGILFCIPHTPISKFVKKKPVLEFIQDVLILGVFAIAICYMLGSGYSPFLYFRF